MSYGRTPYYIWSDGDELRFNSVSVPESEINAFLYKILLTNRREELRERLIDGKQQWMMPMKRWNRETIVLEDVPPDEEYYEWINSEEAIY